ncbi:hypothetical protein EWM64_g1089 [Hericium alpestre]|uniref:Uncharacterized protein n=1 Tax=Hericium alpestre TaxID=135208 RepID=A0A4Z0A8Q5_9AGAM|nr:hypothetical protein EWM64_g1089 [Hericium alpestre]
MQTTQPLTVLASRKVLRLQDVLPAEPLLHLPILLLRSAHKHRYQRTQFIYETLIKACLIHGEILVASLLLALLIKDYELRKYCKGIKEQAEAAAMKGATAQPVRMPVSIPKRGIAYLPDKPPHLTLHEVAKCLSQGISEGPDSPSFPQYSQGLANLVSLLDMPWPTAISTSSLIKLMALYPQNNTMVWIRRHGNCIERGNAFDYFHEMLFTMIKGLISSTNVPYSGPPLNAAAYNTLLNYCLRHRCDVALADGVIKHMTTLRQPPLKPDVTTYNILLRSATLLRRNDIAEDTLSIVRESDSTSTIAQCIQPVTSPTRQDETVVPRPNQEIARLFSRIYKGDLGVPASSIELEADRYTLCSYIAYLTATGNVEDVADVLVQLVPELIGLAVPDTPSLSADGETDIPASARLRALTKAAQRTVVLGPYFFASVLNALSKAGRTGLCERVWRFAKLSEEASWTTPDPWMLTMHSYTAVMQCYAKEARKGLMLRRIAADGSVELTSDAPNKEFAVGWAEQEMKGYAELGQPEQRRAVIAPLMGERVYRTMQNAYQVFWQLRAAREDGVPGLTPPEPDARFYNALLDLLGHAYLTHARRQSASRSRWRRRVRQANQRWREEGAFPPYWRPAIEAVVHDMQTRGFHVPIWYNMMLVGRTDGAPPSMALDEPMNMPRRGSQVRPVAFPKRAPRWFKPHALHIEKTKGLPIRRQGWASNFIEH